MVPPPCPSTPAGDTVWRAVPLTTQPPHHEVRIKASGSFGPTLKARATRCAHRQVVKRDCSLASVCHSNEPRWARFRSNTPNLTSPNMETIHTHTRTRTRTRTRIRARTPAPYAVFHLAAHHVASPISSQRIMPTGSAPNDEEEAPLPSRNSRLSAAGGRKASMTMARAPSGIYGADALASIRAEAEKGRTGTGGKEKGPTIAKAPTPVKVPARGGAAAPKGGSDGDEEEEEAPLPSRNSRLSAAGGRKASMTMARAPSGIYGADALASIRAEAEKGRTAAPKKQESNQVRAEPATLPSLASRAPHVRATCARTFSPTQLAFLDRLYHRPRYLRVVRPPRVQRPTSVASSGRPRERRPVPSPPQTPLPTPPPRPRSAAASLSGGLSGR